jgi:flagellar hook-length control protein FliK
MNDQSLKSLIGPLPAKESAVTDRRRATNNSIESDHDRDSFHSKLMNSMEDNERSARLAATEKSSESNPKEYTQKAYERNTSNASSESNSKMHVQKSDEQNTSDVPSESNSEKHTQKSDEQNTNNIPSELANKKENETDDVNHIKNLILLGMQTNQTASTDGNHIQLNPEVNKNINENEFASAIINKISNQKTSNAQKVLNALPKNPLLNNQESKLPSVANSNIVQKLAGDVTPQSAASISAKLNTTKVATNMAQQVPGDIEQEKTQPSLSDKLSAAQANTKTGEQKILDIINNPGLSEAHSDSKEENSLLQSSRLSAGQATAAESTLNKNKTKANITGQHDLISSVEKTGSNPLSDSNKISNNKTLDLNPLSNTSSQTNENTSNKIEEILKGQHQNKATASNADKNLLAQQGQVSPQLEGEDTPKIFEATAKTVDSKAVKLSDNTMLTGNNNINTIESVMPSNNSSNNSTFNNQSANAEFDFSSNTVNNSQKTRQETNFSNTLSQVNNSGKPLGELGNDVADNIIKNAKLYTQGGKSEVKVQLSPPELGTIKLQFKVENDVLETKITVERSGIKDVIEKDIPRLRELLSSADIDVGKLDVSLQDKENNKMDFMNKEFHSSSQGNNAQSSSQQESEKHENDIDEKVTSNNSESTQINYLV